VNRIAMNVEERLTFSSEELQQIHDLLDQCYPRPPKDVFYRFVAQYKGDVKNYVIITQGLIAGLVQLAPNSKGGTLETLGVHPDHQGQGFAERLVQTLLDSSHGVIQLTTRIPSFFERFGFESIMQLVDESWYMVYVTPEMKKK